MSPLHATLDSASGDTLAARFWSKVEVSPVPDACWKWNACTHPWGYGRLGYRGKVKNATHVSWFLHRGVWPTLNILHSCDNPPCTNPKHLSEGTIADNQRQAVERGRFYHQKQTYCKYGHPFDEANTYRKSNGGRGCRTCLSTTGLDKNHPRVKVVPCNYCQNEVKYFLFRYNKLLSRGRKEFFCNSKCYRLWLSQEKAAHL